jgi:hypothetical protein
MPTLYLVKAEEKFLKGIPKDNYWLLFITRHLNRSKNGENI